ncbi:MAG TPA: Trp biosynthesis-associated membrane protein [Streptosporangiaceae bacterium]
MTGPRTRAVGRPGRELAVMLIGGAAGSGAVFLATRQELARVIARAPSPLPDTVRSVSVQDVRPALAALAVAALASLAAVLATRGVLRRLTGLISVALAAGVAAIAVGRVTAAAALAAAGPDGASLPSGSGAGTAAGSVTAGNGAAAPLGSLGGFPVHVVLGGTGWRALIIAGAVLIAAAGIAVMVRADQLPVMSARYERPAGRRGAVGPSVGSGTTGSGMTSSGMTDSKTVGSKTTSSMWEALSAGADPTARPE